MDDRTQPRIAFNAALLREPYSGVEVMIHETACALTTHGTLPYCIYTPHRLTRPIPSRHRVQIRAVAGNQPRLRRILWEQCSLPRLLRHDGMQLLHAPAYVAPLASPCPVVLTVHDLHIFSHPQCCTTANILHYRLFLPLSIRRAAAITVYSEHVRRALVARFPEAEAKIHVIPPGVPTRFLHATTHATREAVRMRMPPRYLLFVGDLAPRKNLGGVLAAFAQLRAQNPALHLVLAGAPSDLSRQSGWLPSDGVHWLGYVPVDALPALYAMAEALVFPSFDEGFGLPALEAMACGCPVVGSPGGAAEVCGHAALICDPTSPATIVSAILALQCDPSLRRAKVAAGLHRAAQFRWESTITKLETLYRMVCSA